jgi:hypothetical protein
MIPHTLRRFAWWSFLATEAGLVLAAVAYVGLGTRDFWLVVTSAAIAVLAYAIAVRRAPEPTFGNLGATQERWYWF